MMLYLLLLAGKETLKQSQILTMIMAGAGHGLVPTYPRVMTGKDLREDAYYNETLKLILGDLENCHIFYQSDTPNPAPMSCGEMMFNTETQVRFLFVISAKN